jgi:predicted extracellular nuclease
LNYFTTLDEGQSICGPNQNLGCRGADDADELARQRAKIVAAISDLDADVVGLIEIENNANDTALIDLVQGVNDANGAGTYAYVASGPAGTDAIKVALIYKTATVSLLGDHAILDTDVDGRFDDSRNRPVLAQSFISDTTGGIVTVAVNHLKSKGSACGSSDPDLNDGAGNCNLTRESAAIALVDWLATDPTGSGQDEFLIIGDLNSYDKEDPIDAILAGGYTDLIHAFRGENAYGYVFDGQTGYLDYALSSEALTGKVTGATEWHINADEPDLIDYNTDFKQPDQQAIYAPDAYRSSDHDPVLVGLDVCDEVAPSFDEVSFSPNILWPANHKYVDVSATVVASDNFDPAPLVSLLSVSSNEPDNGSGDGNTVNDIVVVNDYEFKLRAERSGSGSGRVYSVTYQVTDFCGNSATATGTVLVPHSKGKGK